MKKLSILLFALLVISTSISAKKKSALGSWLLVKIEEKGEIMQPYAEITFKDDGYAIWDGRVFGTWEQSKKNFTLESKMIKELSAEWKISKFKDGELVLTKPDTKLFFIIFDKAKIEEDNKNSGLEGVWKVDEVIMKATEEAIEEAVEEITEGAVEEATEENGSEEYSDVELEDRDNETKKTLIFSLPDTYKRLEEFNGGTSSESGTWMYNKTKSSLVLIDGRNAQKFELVKLTEKELIIDNNKETMVATKIELGNLKIIRLGFTEEDFFDENGDYLYNDDSEKLPWNDTYKTMDFLENVKALVYNYSIKLRDIELFDTKEIVAKVSSSTEKMTIDINNIFENGDSYTFSANDEYYENSFYDNNRLYPLDGNYYSFRVTGQEKITTAAGTFDCTVIDACGHSEKTYRIWMINDKPGIFAKVIEERPDSFDENFTYKVYELIEIK